MASSSRLTSRFISRLLQTKTPNSQTRTIFTTIRNPQSQTRPIFNPQFRYLSTNRRIPTRPSKPDIGARARQMQNRRLWTYAITFSCIAGFIIIVLNQFEDQLVFYVTPTDALSKYVENPNKNKFRLGGLVLEGSVAHPASSHEIEFVITDLITDMLVRYEGQVPDLFREGHSVVVEGFVKPITDKIKNEVGEKSVSEKARSVDCYFSASEVLAKHDEKYMPAEVANAIEKNKKILAAAAEDEGNKDQSDGGKEGVSSS
uniref:cytochrome c-type biogenesis protein CcmE homolog, mitochondrial n=1 Tax=Erigeron canadensis TaxID=72917 RepID=UPI001CB90D7D|nr:cytochrome c-type biogenesis protein CcmE homolog, mitochondrial [Erigeron canadensis]